MEHFQAVCLCFFPQKKPRTIDKHWTAKKRRKKTNLWFEWHSHLTEQLNHGRWNKLQTHINYLAQTEPESEMFSEPWKKFVSVNSFPCQPGRLWKSTVLNEECKHEMNNSCQQTIHAGRGMGTWLCAVLACFSVLQRLMTSITRIFLICITSRTLVRMVIAERFAEEVLFVLWNRCYTATWCHQQKLSN